MQEKNCKGEFEKCVGYEFGADTDGLHPAGISIRSSDIRRLGYFLSPFRGLIECWCAYPRLAPWAAFFRSFGACVSKVNVTHVTDSDLWIVKL
jgi:hypothetical protein